MNNYLEVILKISPPFPGIDIFTYELGELGFDSFVEEEGKLKAYVKEDKYDGGVEEVVNRYVDQFAVQVEYNTIKEQNWNEEWEKQFNPIYVEKEIIVRAPFHKTEEGFRYEVLIEPQMSFGTGHHATTWLVMKKMLELDFINKDVLDMGCGTGILAILAEKLGANGIEAIDIDDWSYENTLTNCKLNNSKKINVEKGGKELLGDKQFHIILANINRNILLDQLEVYSEVIKDEGVLLLSGFFTTDNHILREEAEKLGFVFVEKEEKDEWSVLKFKKALK